MTPSQVRKINVLIQKNMMTPDQTRLLITLMITPTTTLTEVSNAFYGTRKEGEKISLRLMYIRRYLKELTLKLDYWSLPHIIVIHKDGNVTLREKVEINEPLND